MRYTLISIAFLLFACTATAQDTLTRFLDDQLNPVDGPEEASFSASVYKKDNHWEAIIYYGTGNVAGNGVYKDKKLKIKHGWFTFFYSATGRKMYRVRYDNNYQVDTWQSWYENGRPRDSGQLDDGKKTGYWQTWHSNGMLAASGAFTTTYPMEIPYVEGVFPAEKRERRAFFLARQPDMRTGLWKTWYRNGQIKDSLRYNNGKEEGIARSWYSNGGLESVGASINGKAEGTWEWFHENGQRATIEQYKDGKITGMQCFDTLGKLAGDFCSLAKPALFPGGGTVAFEEYLKKNLHYPERAGSLKGYVEMEVTIGANGKTIAVDIDESPSNYFSQEAERLVYEMPVWEPAISHNRAVPFIVSVKLAFSPPK